MMSLVPAAMRSCASIAAFIAEPHILLTVVQPVASGRPALIDAWRAGAWPWPAGSTLPMITSCTSAGLMPARSTAALIATAPRSLAASGAKSPINPPIRRSGRAYDNNRIVQHSRVPFIRAASRRAAAEAEARRRSSDIGPPSRRRSARRTCTRSCIFARRPPPAATAPRISRTQASIRAPCHLVSLNSSRPTSIRRISDVPAPIS